MINSRIFTKISLAFGIMLISIYAAAEEPREARKLAREASLAAESGNREKAVELFQQAAEIAPDSGRILYSLGTAQAQLEDYQTAGDVLSRSLNFDDVSRPEDAWFNLGLAQFEQAMAVDPQAPTAGEQRMEKLKESLQSFRQSIIKNPTEADAKHNYEKVLKMIRDMEQQQEEQEGEQEQEEQQEGEEEQEGEGENEEEQEGEQDQEQEGEQEEQQEGEGENEESEQDKEGEGDSEQQEGEEEGEEQEQEEGMESGEATPTPTPEPREENQPQPGEASEPEEAEYTPEQLDALRVLNALEETKPEQYKQVFQMKSKSGAKEKNW